MNHLEMYMITGRNHDLLCCNAEFTEVDTWWHFRFQDNRFFSLSNVRVSDRSLAKVNKYSSIEDLFLCVTILCSIFGLVKLFQ